MKKYLKVISLVLLFSMLVNILPLSWLPEVLDMKGANAEGLLTREDFKKFENKIAVGGSHTVILNDDGTVDSIGTNYYGETNVGDWKNIIAVAAGGQSTVGLKGDGTVVAVGSYGAKQPGQKDLSEWTNIVSIAVGTNHIVGLKSDGTVVAFGYNDSGQTNVGDWKDIIAIEAGSSATFGIKSDGTVIAVGYNYNGQLNVSGWNNIVAVTASAYDTFGLRADGTVVTTGWGAYSKGDASSWNNIVEISSAYGHVVGLKNDGTVVAVGDSSIGRTNVGDWKNIVAIDAGDGNTIGLKSDGTIISTGDNGTETVHLNGWKDVNSVIENQNTTFGLKSDGTLIGTGQFGIIDENDISQWQNIESISARFYHILGLKKDGTVVASGTYDYGQLNVSSWSNITAISAGHQHSVGLKKDGTVVAVGNNDYGQLNVNDWKDITAISAGNFHTVGLKKDGTVVGVGPYGTNVDSWTDITAVAAGGYHTVGLKSDGTVVATGNNEYGQTNVSGWRNIIAVAAGENHTVGLRSDGTVVAVGKNDHGELNVSGWKDVQSISAGLQSTKGYKKNGVILTTDGKFYTKDELVKPQLRINKKTYKPNDEIIITLSKGNFYNISHPTITFSGGISLVDAEMTPLPNGDFEYRYIPNATEIGKVNLSISGVEDPFGNNLQADGLFSIIPVQSIKSSKTVTSSGEKVTLTATFNEGVKPDFKLSLSGATTLSATKMTEVAGSNGTKYMFTYTVPYNYKEGPVDATLTNVETVNGQIFNRFTDENVFLKQNRLAPISSITSSENKAKIGDTVTITANFSESVKSGVKISFDGADNMAPVYMNQTAGSNGMQYMYNYIVPEGYTGKMNAHITEVYDLNNKLSQEYVSKNLFEIDGIRPTISSLSPSLTAAKLGDKVVIRAVFDEPVKPDFMLSLYGDVDIRDLSMQEVEGSNSTVYEYSYLVKEGDLGFVSAQIRNVEDLVGNPYGVYNSDVYNKLNIFQADGVSPALSSLEPEDKEYEVGDYAHITASFTEPVKPGVKITLSGGVNHEEYVMSEVQGSNGKEYELYYEVKEGQKGIVNGLLTNVIDLAGNEVTAAKEKVFYISDPSNANLATISVTDGGTRYSLTPEFSAGIDTYSTYLPSHVTSVWVNGETEDSKATIERNGLKNLVQGENSFILKVTSSNLSTKFYKVIINVADDTKPIISGVKDQTIGLDTSFDPVDGVEAWDNVDGNITSLMKVEGSVNIHKPGNYDLVYTVTDQAGNHAAVYRRVTVVDNIAPLAPEVNPIGDNQLVINGKAEPNATVVAKAYGSSIGWAQVAEDGSFTIAIDKQNAGTEISVHAVDMYGNPGEATRVVVKDVTAPGNPVINDPTDKDTIITGNAEPGSKLDVKVNDVIIGTGTVGESGQYSVTIPVQKAGTEIAIIAIDQAGNVSKTTKVVVKDITSPEKPVANEVTDKDTSVTGLAEAGSKVEVKVNGSVIGAGTAGEDGQFKVTFDLQKAGTNLEVVVTDSAGNVSETTTVVVKDITSPAKPGVNEVTDKDTAVTGQVEAGSKVEVKLNGSVIGTGTAGEDGQYKMTIDVQKAGTELVIVATDKAGNVSEITTVVVRDATAPGLPEVNEVTDKDNSVTGLAEAGSKVEVKVNGSVIGAGTAGEDGQFKVTFDMQKAGTKLEVVATDNAGNVSEITTLVVKDVTAPKKPTVNEVTDKDTSVTGQAETGSKVVVKVKGLVIGTGTAGEDGQFKVTIDLQKATAELEVVAIDNAGNESETTTLFVKDATAPEKPLVNEVTDKDTSVTGHAEAGSKVEVKIKGSVIGTESAGEDGQYQVIIDAQKAGTELVIVATDNSGNASDGTPVVVKDVTAPEKPEVSTVSDKDTTITGLAEAGSKIEVKVNGVVIGTGKAEQDRKYQVTIRVQKAGTVLTVIAIDTAENESESVTIKVIDKTAPSFLTVNTVSDKSKEVTGKTEAGATVSVLIGTKIYPAKFDTSGNFKVIIPVQKAGTKVIVTAKDAAGNSVAKTITVIDKTAPVVPSVTTVTDLIKVVTGKAEAGAIVTVTIGTKKYIVKADIKGNYQVTIPVQKAGTKLLVTAKDAAGNISAAKSVIVIDKTAPLAPKIKTAVKSTTKEVSGTAEAYSTITIKVGKKVIGTAKADSKGKFKVKIKAQKKKTVLSVTATDRAKNVSKVVTVKVK